VQEKKGAFHCGANFVLALADWEKGAGSISALKIDFSPAVARGI